MTTATKKYSTTIGMQPPKVCAMILTRFHYVDEPRGQCFPDQKLDFRQPGRVRHDHEGKFGYALSVCFTGEHTLTDRANAPMSCLPEELVEVVS
jgi:hypothetical protein